ncbi:MAG: hypothetical protein IPN42_00520 [Methylococcaceae bacterium]|nr:hypothetical protein [Methylococcaceae bacterium]
MKHTVMIVLMACFSMNAFAWTSTHSAWDNDSYSYVKKRRSCPAKPVTIQTACDLKSYAASTPGSTAYGFFQGYVVSAFRTQQPLQPTCSYTGTDQQAIDAAIAFLNTISTQQCATITATAALNNAFEAASLVSCPVDFRMTVCFNTFL